MFNPLDLTGKLILVTGASSGIGRATANVLAKLGARVILSGRRESALMETLDAMENRSLHLVEPHDLSQVEGIHEWLKGAVARAGAPLDGLVHSAGVSGTTPIRAINRKHVDEIMLPNVYATLMLLRSATARGVGAEGGSIVLISSASALAASAGLVTYTGSKGAMHSIAMSAAKELAGKRIRVNCIAPGYVSTPMLDQALNGLTRVSEVLEQRQYLGVIAPEDIGVSAAYLLSDSARCVTGTTLVVDGGYST